ncbi:ATP-dependent Clp protease proteolytic subunit [Candidatus Halobeggiatoa sp. HSG11]|nr:ATP-dependent Clp protease proteolytic subunit [Candidatus Halobeggiatoa sp. HSG11]
MKQYLALFLLIFASNIIAQDVNEKPKESVKSIATIVDDDPEIQKLKKQYDLLKLQNAILSTQNVIQAEQHQKELMQLSKEKDKLQLQNELVAEQNQEKLAKLIAEKEKLLLENELETAKRQQLVSNLEGMKTRLELESQIHEYEKKQMFLALEQEREQLAMKNSIVAEKNKHEELKIQLEATLLNFEMTKLEYERSKRTIRIEELGEKIAERDQKEMWEDQVNKPIQYLEDPFVDGHLTISDRRIELDEVIFPGTAEYVNERIHYFNNKNSEYPIFLVIDRCYGGSVMEGSKILEAMQNSQAPVYVVVKALSASMAAIITSLADRSFAYPNAIIVHHQMMSFMFGNRTQIEEELEIGKEWTKRVMQPVADKMGITMDDFVKKMYASSSSGNWQEFGDNAIKIKWVDTIVKDIRDTSFNRRPIDMEEAEEDIFIFAKEEKIDSQGNSYVKLPNLSPLDVYYLYNPYNYFR